MTNVVYVDGKYLEYPNLLISSYIYVMIFDMQIGQIFGDLWTLEMINKFIKKSKNDQSRQCCNLEENIQNTEFIDIILYKYYLQYTKSVLIGTPQFSLFSCFPSYFTKVYLISSLGIFYPYHIVLFTFFFSFLNHKT